MVVNGQSVTCVYGSYTGTASSLTVTGVGFTPAALFVKGGSQPCYVKTSDMTSTHSRKWASNGNTVTDGITGFTSDGFTVGTNTEVNASSTTFLFPGHFIFIYRNEKR